MLILKDRGKRFLFECARDELAALAMAWGEVTAALMGVMPAVGRPTAHMKQLRDQVSAEEEPTALTAQ